MACASCHIDQAGDTSNCGLFKSVSLRNTATRHVFCHNGRFHTLKDTLRFYVQRDTNPTKWHPKDPHGAIDRFNDLPVAPRVNVDATDKPLIRKTDERPVRPERDIDAVAAFLASLNETTLRAEAEAAALTRQQALPAVILQMNLGAFWV